MAWELIGNAGANPAINFLGTTDPQPLVIKTNGAEALRVDMNGNVGIGTPSPITATGGRVLHIDNPRGASALRLGDGATNGQQWEWQSTVINTTSQLQVTVNGAMNLSNLSNNTNPLTVLANGNVGIGTKQPSQKLTLGAGNMLLPDADHGSHGNLYFGGITDAGETGMRLFGGEVNRPHPPDPSTPAIRAGFIDVCTPDLSDGLRIRVDTTSGGTERMRVTAEGNVGIGTTSPHEKLHVISQSLAVLGESGSGTGVKGKTDNGTGVLGESSGGIAVHGINRSHGLAGRFDGNVEIAAGGGIKFQVDGTGLGFFGAGTAPQPTVTGSRGGNVALASLLTALANLGLLVDSTSP
jgi:hypothetical protein